MKRFFTLLALLLAFTASVQAEWPEDYARLLKKYVTPAGVRYADWKSSPEDMKAIRKVVDGIASAPVPAAKNKEALAFYVNAYNAWILHEALEKYPLKSVKDTLFTFFMSNRILVAGEKMSFNKLENDMIRARFSEPRIHFALNCASRSCPPLRSEPYSGAELDSQFEQQARIYINSPHGVIPTRDGAQISKIFDWNKADFEVTGGVLVVLNKRLAKPLRADAKLTYQDYDWSLNEVK